MSKVRKTYMVRFVIRCITLVLCAVLLFVRPQTFDVLDGMNFFNRFSVLHLLWGAWVFDMVKQIVPIGHRISLGSQKLFANRFKAAREKVDAKALREYIVKTTKAAYKVFILWCLLIAAIGVLYFTGIFNEAFLLMCTVVFYVCDLICVLFWCPFRLMMKTRCCTTCRIFNWDHFMMFSPLIFAGGFYAISLVSLSLVAFFLWELGIILHPERFWEHSNTALKCSECTDKLCTQYCQKLRK